MYELWIYLIGCISLVGIPTAIKLFKKIVNLFTTKIINKAFHANNRKNGHDKKGKHY